MLKQRQKKTCQVFGNLTRLMIHSPKGKRCQSFKLRQRYGCEKDTNVRKRAECHSDSTCGVLFHFKVAALVAYF